MSDVSEQSVHRFDTRLRVPNGVSVDGSLHFFGSGFRFQPNAAALPSVLLGVFGAARSMSQRIDEYGFEFDYTSIVGAYDIDGGFGVQCDEFDMRFTFPTFAAMRDMFEAIGVATNRSVDVSGRELRYVPLKRDGLGDVGVVSDLVLTGHKPRKWSELVATGFLGVVAAALITIKIIDRL